MGRRKFRKSKPKNEGLEIVTVDAAPLNRLMKAIEALPGDKLLTLSIFDGRTVEIEVDASGRYGDTGLIAKSLFSAKLVSAMYTGGGMIIRQATPLSMEVNCPEHGPHMRTICNIYGVAFGENQWVVVPAEDVEWAHTHDARTGKAIEREPNARYLALPVPA